MYKIILNTKDFSGDFIEDEVKILTGKELNCINDEYFSYEFKDLGELNEFVYNIIFLSRTVDGIYLEICDAKTSKISSHIKDLFSNKNMFFEINSKTKIFDKKKTEIDFGNLIREELELNVDLKEYDFSFKIFDIEEDLEKKKRGKDKNKISTVCALDLVGFDLSKREYKLNSDSKSINSSVPNFLFSLMGIDEEEDEFSIIDISANLGDVIIEASMYNKRLPLNIRQKTKLPIYKLLKKIAKTPRVDSSKNKVIAVVQNNKTFKDLRENINFAGQKVKISQYDFDWLDVKFQAQDIDYVVSQFPCFDTEKEFLDYQDEFFYQAEFIVERLIGVISKKKINKSVLEKYKLQIEEEEEVIVGEQKYFVYVILPVGEKEDDEESKEDSEEGSNDKKNNTKK